MLSYFFIKNSETTFLNFNIDTKQLSKDTSFHQQIIEIRVIIFEKTIYHHIMIHIIV